MDLERWQEIDRIFLQALALQSAARAAFLDEACRGDGELRAEVEALLARDQESVALLDEPLGVSMDDLPAVGEGDYIGPWRLGRRIGEGGASVVFEAQRADLAYARQVAVKILRQGLLSGRALERFRLECEVLARLEHPDIARLYDAGQTDKGLPYIVLERVEGLPLDEWCRREKPPLADRLRLFRRVCEAVAFAHRNLIVHRDLKPGNVLVTPDGEPRLLDFGIARVLPGEGPEATRLTRTHQQPMTPQYASPEQLRGEDVSTASDVYSLGLLLYELLTGALPYRLEPGLGETARRLVEGNLTIRAPSVAAAQSDAAEESLRPSELRGDLDLIVTTALAIEPERRYSAARALSVDLERFDRGQPILARVPSVAYLLRRFAGRHRFGLAMAGVVVVMIVSFAAVTGLRIYRANLEQESDVVFYRVGVDEASELCGPQDQQPSPRGLLGIDAAPWLASEGLPRVARATLAAAIGKGYLELSLLPEARRYLEASLALRQEVGEPSALAESHRLLARLDWTEARFEEAARHAREAASLLEPLGEPIARAEALAFEGRSLGRLGRLDAAEEALENALALLGPEPRAHPALAGIVLRELGSISLLRGEDGRAGERISQALDSLIAAHGWFHPEVLAGHRLLAAVAERQGPPGPPALGVGTPEDQHAADGEGLEQIVWTLTDLAAQRLEAQRFAEAVDTYRQARQMQAELSGDEHFLLAVIETGLGYALWRQGEREESIEYFRHAVDIARRHAEPGSYDFAFPTLYLGGASAWTGRCSEALPLLREALSAFDPVVDSPAFGQVSARFSIAYCDWQLGDRETAKVRMREILAEADPPGSGTNRDVRAQVEEWRGILARIDGDSEPTG